MNPALRSRPDTPARSSDDWIERVRGASDLVEIVGQTVTLRRSGKNWVGLCPFHQEKTPSFSVHPERQFYHCFSCKAGGDVFKFVQETETLGFLEAAELLSRRAGIPIPERRAGERGTKGPLLEVLEAASNHYHQWLFDPATGASARSYLESRGITLEVAREFRLGLAPAGWEHLVQRLAGRFGEDTLIQAGLAARRDSGRGAYDRFRNRLMVPLIAPGGAVLGFGARALAPDDEPKYLNSPETAVYHKGSFLFGLEQARKHVRAADEMIVVEGYFDAIALHQSGLGHTVATSGTALTQDQARMLKRSVARIALNYDGDAAGQEAMMRSLGILLGEGLDVVVVDLPAGEDPDSLVRKGGAEAWNRARREAADPVEFIQRHGLRTRGPGDPRERALQAVVRLLTEIPDPIRAALFVERASRVFGIGEAVIRRAADLKRSGQRAEPALAAAVRERSSGESHVERELLQALLASPPLLDAIRDAVGPEDFRDASCATLARWLWSGEPAPTDALAEALARELTARAAESSDWAAMAHGAARRLQRRRLERRKKEIDERLSRLEKVAPGGTDETRDLLEESLHLGVQIRELARSNPNP
jgi:DNA primase